MVSPVVFVSAMDDVGPRTMSFRSSLFKETVPAGCD